MLNRKAALGALVTVLTATVASGAFAASLLTTNTLSENTTGLSDSIFIGAPDDIYVGIGGQIVEFDFGLDRIIDGAGGDLNVYEVDFGSPEFGSVSVSASLDGLTYYDLTSTAAPLVPVEGDETHSNAAFARSYDLDGLLSEARYIRLDGLGSSFPSGCCNLFDLDAIGGVNYTIGGDRPEVIPLPASLPLLLGGILGLGIVRRKRRT